MSEKFLDFHTVMVPLHENWFLRARPNAGFNLGMPICRHQKNPLLRGLFCHHVLPFVKEGGLIDQGQVKEDLVTYVIW